MSWPRPSFRPLRSNWPVRSSDPAIPPPQAIPSNRTTQVVANLSATRLSPRVGIMRVSLLGVNAMDAMRWTPLGAPESSLPSRGLLVEGDPLCVGDAVVVLPLRLVQPREAGELRVRHYEVSSLFFCEASSSWTQSLDGRSSEAHIGAYSSSSSGRKQSSGLSGGSGASIGAVISRLASEGPTLRR